MIASLITAMIIALGLICANALYVAAEFATVSTRSSIIRARAIAGDKQASRLLAVIEDPRQLDDYIASCQIGITLSSLILGAFSQWAFGGFFSELFSRTLISEEALASSIAAITVLTIFTFLQILFGELIPKSVALEHSERTALILLIPLKFSSVILKPFIWLLNGSGNILLKAVGIKESTHKHIHSLEEISLLLAESKEGGLLDADEHARLHQALELSGRTVKHLMTPANKIFCLRADSSIDEAYPVAQTSPYTRIIVHGDSLDDIKGIINVKDIIHAHLTDAPGFIGDLARKVPIVPETLPLARLLNLLKARHSHVAVVLDEHGATRGIITAGDILAEVMEDAESDNFEKSEHLEALPDGRTRVPGSYKLHRLKKLLGKLPDCDAETLNGLIIWYLEKIPTEGDIIEFEEASIEVETVAEHRAVSLLVSRKQRKSNI